MTPISYRMVGQYDQLFQIDIGADGSYILQSGSYRSASPRRGSLNSALQANINRLAGAVRSPPPPPPEVADGFVSELVLNPGRSAEVIRWWGPLHEADSPLARLVGLFRSLN
jgi:hypothetical protein